jgi:hypothetical protein
MYRTILCAAAGAVSFAMPAKADETLKWRQVQHVTSNQNQPVGDVDGHLLGVIRLPGIVFFPDGSTGTSLVIGTYDVVATGGPINGYYTVNFSDGSALWMKYTGTTIYSPKNQQKGTAIVIGGKGKYAGATGDGTWEGVTTQAAATSDGAIQYVDSVINIKK